MWRMYIVDYCCTLVGDFILVFIETDLDEIKFATVFMNR